MRIEPSRASHPDWIVVEDPEREYAEGALVATTINHKLMSREACTLPVSIAFMRRGGVAGYMRRGYGAGAFLTDQPKMLSAFALFSTRGAHILHWRARLIPTAETKTRILANQSLDGSIRVIADSSQGGHIAGVAAASGSVQARQLGSLDGRGGWTVGGEAPTQFAIDGFYGLSIYGAMSGVRVAWAAASLTER